MTLTGPIALLAFGFDAQGPLPVDVERRIDGLHGRGVVQILDVLYVSKDEHGSLRVEGEGIGGDAGSGPSESALWQLLEGNDVESLLAVSLELRSACEVGIDLEGIEGIEDLIQPGTSALLMLAEPIWVGDLLDEVLTSGGHPIVLGYLQPETMLVLGPKLASAASVARVPERTAAIRGAAMLDALRTEKPTMRITAQVITALVDAHLLHESDVDEAIDALAAAGLLPRSPILRARGQAAATVAEVARIDDHRHGA